MTPELYQYFRCKSMLLFTMRQFFTNALQKQSWLIHCQKYRKILYTEKIVYITTLHKHAYFYPTQMLLHYNDSLKNNILQEHKKKKKSLLFTLKAVFYLICSCKNNVSLLGRVVCSNFGNYPTRNYRSMF